MHSQAKAQFEAVDKVVRLADVVRKGIDSLVSKGPAVSVDDVLDEMAVLVSKGADPKALSAMMAGGNGTPPMPEGGEALQAWVAQQDQMVSQKEQVLKEQQAATRHEAAVGALHMLAHDHIVRKGAMGQAALAPEGPSAPESSNPLTRGPSDA